jgi:hypothetical protein
MGLLIWPADKLVRADAGRISPTVHFLPADLTVCMTGVGEWSLRRYFLLDGTTITFVTPNQFQPFPTHMRSPVKPQQYARKSGQSP